MEVIAPQPGKQTQFLQCPADVVFYGGAAGGGKTYGILLATGRYINVPHYGSTIFRKEGVQLRQTGGLWDVGRQLFVPTGAKINKMDMSFSWQKHNSSIRMSYIDNDDALMKWQGSQIPIICFDELTHFTKMQFLYMLSRNRNPYDNGIKPQIIASTNPDSGSWVRDFLDWYIDPETGYAIESRCGVIRWFINYHDEIHWYDTREAAVKDFKRYDILPKSFSFISSNLNDNQILKQRDGGYEANLMAMPKVERERFLKGNWNISPSSGDYFNRFDFEMIDATPPLTKMVRAWDFGASKPNDLNRDPDYTVGVKVGIDKSGVFYVLDMIRFRENPAKMEVLFLNARSHDGLETDIKIPQDPGAAGKAYANNLIRLCRGSVIEAQAVSGDKVTRARVASSQSNAGNVKVLKAKWNSDFFNELEAFPVDKNGIGHDDIVDAFSDAVLYLSESKSRINIVSRNSLPRALREF